MLTAKSISVVLAIALSGSSFAATSAEFKFPTKKFAKDECDRICHYGLERYRSQLEEYSAQITHSLVGLTTFAVGYVLAYQIHATRARVVDNGVPGAGVALVEAAAELVQGNTPGTGGKAKAAARGRSRSKKRG
jgi:hypothetical protein